MIWRVTLGFIHLLASWNSPLSGTIRIALKHGCSLVLTSWQIWFFEWWMGPFCGILPGYLSFSLQTNWEEWTQQCCLQVRITVYARRETPNAFWFSLGSLVLCFSSGSSLKATVHLKIETVPPLGSGLINCNDASCYVCNSFLSFVLDRAQSKARLLFFLPRSPRFEV